MLYHLLTTIRNKAYSAGMLRRRKLSVPVISVGNLSTGGTGKTQAVAKIVSILRTLNRRPGILSRGYGRRKKSDLIITGRENNVLWEDAGDEPSMLYRKLGCPMGIGANRFVTGDRLLSCTAVDCLVLDDGFQHQGLYRDIDIVVVDADDPPWENRLLPFGKLRESVSSLLRAHGFIVTGNSDERRNSVCKKLGKLYRNKQCFNASTEPVLWYLFNNGQEINPDQLKNRKIAAFAGIANPHRFEETLGKAGIHVSERKWFRDHYSYNHSDFRRMTDEFAARGIEYMITTEKDAARLSGISVNTGKLVVLGVEMNIIEDSKFADWLVYS